MGDHIDIAAHIDLAALAAACAALGIDIDTLPRHLREAPPQDGVASRPQDIPLALADAEWAMLAPLLPPEPPQADTLDNRAVLDQVIWVIEGTHEAVRRKFGRWAHAGVWQRLHADASAAGALHPQRLMHLKRIAQRAETLAGKRARPGG
jgi:transposase